MSDKERLINLYHDMYEAMIKKDEQKLNEIHDDSFVLIHMTGMKQNKNEYINAIKNGILNYFSEQTDHIEIRLIYNRVVRNISIYG